MFSFHVGENPTMTMGYYDKSKFKGDIHWSPIEYKYMFGIKLDDIMVGGKRLNICKGQESCLATVDSGSSVNMFPAFAQKVMHEANLPSTKGVKCKKPEDYGDLTLILNGKEFIIPNKEWVYN
jgi:hypothetical protein